MKIFKKNNKKSTSPPTNSNSPSSPVAANSPGSQKFPTNEKFANSKVFAKKLPLDPNDLPPFVLKAMSYLDENGLKIEGIFRISPKKSDEDEVIQQLEQNIKFDVPYEKYEIHLASSLLKLYLRELMDPLLTYEQYGMFLAAERIPDEEQRLVMIQKVIKFLPPTNFTILKNLCLFLKKVAANSSINKMSPSNLAIVFAPNLLKSDLPQSHMEILQDSKYSSNLMTTLIAEAHSIFGDDESSNNSSSTSSSSSVSASSISSSNTSNNSSSSSTTASTTATVSNTQTTTTTTTSTTQQQQQEEQLEEGWVAYYDYGSNQYYYHHAQSGTTTWDKPVKKQAPPPQISTTPHNGIKTHSGYLKALPTPTSPQTSFNQPPVLLNPLEMNNSKQTYLTEPPVMEVMDISPKQRQAVVDQRQESPQQYDTTEDVKSNSDEEMSQQPTANTVEGVNQQQTAEVDNEGQTVRKIKIPVRKRAVVRDSRRPLPNPNAPRFQSTIGNRMPRKSTSGYESDDACVVDEEEE
ncbi:rho GTPase activating protein [Naegleria gruberi]|uniref:Rho GTPase activating protein n=1 Tax=Naegleria gruberi TaxID=5762 RepID=D2VRC5_NAEGR|nr:rho GTPase activating protein [Naegleria gruberi]EFC40646.1 rho GTPase activating protein [Naegleria gruberi]|eukprot:XP_002673390.1 rho GTPase activating protein [Naegleria gruberi strain NEG-M]